MFIATGGHRQSDFERLSTMRLHRLQGRFKRTSQDPPENVQEVEHFIKEIQALDNDEVEEEIGRLE